DTFEITCSNGMRGDLHSESLLQMIRAANMIAVQVCEPDLPDISLIENVIEHYLLFLVWRGGIDDAGFLPSHNVTVRLVRWRRGRGCHTGEPEAPPPL